MILSKQARVSISNTLMQSQSAEVVLQSFNDLFTAISVLNGKVINLFDDVYFECLQVSNQWNFQTDANMTNYVMATLSNGKTRVEQWLIDHDLSGNEVLSVGNKLIKGSLKDILQTYSLNLAYFFTNDFTDSRYNDITYFIDNYFNDYSSYTIKATDSNNATTRVSWGDIVGQIQEDYANSTLMSYSITNVGKDYVSALNDLTLFSQSILNNASSITNRAVSTISNIISCTRNKASSMVSNLSQMIKGALDNVLNNDQNALPSASDRSEFSGYAPIWSMFSWLSYFDLSLEGAVQTWASFTVTKWSFINSVVQLLNKFSVGLLDLISPIFEKGTNPYDITIINKDSNQYTVAGWYCDSDLLNSTREYTISGIEDIGVAKTVINKYNEVMSQVYHFDAVFGEFLLTPEATILTDSNGTFTGSIHIRVPYRFKLKPIANDPFEAFCSGIVRVLNGNHYRFRYESYESFMNYYSTLCHTSPADLYVDANEEVFDEKEFRRGYVRSIIVALFFSAYAHRADDNGASVAGYPLMGYDTSESWLENGYTYAFMNPEAYDKVVTNEVLVNMNTMSQVQSGNTIYFKDFWTNYLRVKSGGFPVSVEANDIIGDIPAYIASTYELLLEGDNTENLLVCLGRNNTFKDSRLMIKTDKQNTKEWLGTLGKIALITVSAAAIFVGAYAGISISRARTQKLGNAMKDFTNAQISGDYSNLSYRQIKKISNAYGNGSTGSILNAASNLSNSELFEQCNLIAKLIKN